MNRLSFIRALLLAPLALKLGLKAKAASKPMGPVSPTGLPGPVGPSGLCRPGTLDDLCCIRRTIIADFRVCAEWTELEPDDQEHRQALSVCVSRQDIDELNNSMVLKGYFGGYSGDQLDLLQQTNGSMYVAARTVAACRMHGLINAYAVRVGDHDGCYHAMVHGYWQEPLPVSAKTILEG